jgi:hypothetical protein
MEDLGEDGWGNKTNIQEVDCERVDWMEKHVQVMGPYDGGNRPWGTVRGEEFLA